MFSEFELDPCEACRREDARSIHERDYDGIHQECPRCGEFFLSGTAMGVVRSGLGDDFRAKLSGWIREQNQHGHVPVLTASVLNGLRDRQLPPISERAYRILREAARSQTVLGERFNSGEPRFLAASYSKSPEEVAFLMKLLSDQGLAEHVAMGGEAEILPAGYFQLDEWDHAAHVSPTAFVAMWFTEETQAAYDDGMQVGVVRAGYDPVRVDKVEHINKIDDEIILRIKASRFVVADFTGHRGGVYFEAGFALGLGLPVIWTCRHDYLDDLHFDIRQYNCIVWQTPGELAERLYRRIEASVGRGPRAESN